MKTQLYNYNYNNITIYLDFLSMKLERNTQNLMIFYDEKVKVKCDNLPSNHFFLYT